MHTCVYVLINGPIKNTHKLVAEAMAPFDEALPVAPYTVHLTRGATQTMANHYGVSEYDLRALRPKLEEWFGRPGGIDEFGLFTISNENPFGRWDWYQIGGLWDGYLWGRKRPDEPKPVVSLERNMMPVDRFLRSRHLSNRLPEAIVTPSGEWISRSVDIGTNYGWFLRELHLTEWARRVRRVMRAFPNHRIVCVDAHS